MALPSGLDHSVLFSLEQQRQSLWQEHPNWSNEHKQQAWDQRRRQLAEYLLSDMTPWQSERGLSTRPSNAVDIPGARKRTYSTHSDRVRRSRTKLSATAKRPSLASSLPTNSRPKVESMTTSEPISSTCYFDSRSDFGFPATSQSDSCQVYDVDEYLQHIDAPASAPLLGKRQKLNCENMNWDQSCMQQATGASLLTSDSFDFSVPKLTPSTSASSCLLTPPGSVPMSAEMSRVSSVNSSALAASFGMMRFESAHSNVSDLLFPVDEDKNMSESVFSCSTAKPHGDGLSDTDAGLVRGDSVAFFGDVGYDAQDFSFLYSSSFNDNDCVMQSSNHNQGSSLATQEPTLARMERTDSGSSTWSNSSLSSSEFKTTQRRQRHIKNSKQSIAPKLSLDSPIAANEGNSCGLKPENIKLERLGGRKEAIAKQPCTRSQHSKLKCTLCTEHPKGFRGEHELRRHKERAHTQCRRVWICTEPAKRTEYWPSSPLSICKYCNSQKKYNVYYNAAAHLRRAHFNPRKRGRKPRGEQRESRAGKTGGDWPPIDWLKKHGWLKEIEVFGNVEDSGSSSGDASELFDGVCTVATTDVVPQEAGKAWTLDLDYATFNDVQEEQMAYEGLFPDACSATADYGFEFGGTC